MLLEELVTANPVLNIDVHNHIKTGGRGNINRFLGEGLSDLPGFLDRFMKTNLDILYITNFSDSRAEDWTSEEQLALARKAGYEVEQGEYYTFFKKDGKVKALGKSQEVPTSQGHILFAGLKRNKKFSDGKTLDETLEQANDNELKIADHPYTIIEKSGVLRRSKTPEQDAKKFDCLEKNGNFSPFSFPFSIANYLVRKYSKKYHKPLIASSDGHHPKDIGKTYNIFKRESLDYTSERAFRDSIAKAVRENNFSYRFRPIPPWRVFHHILMVGLYALRDKYRSVFRRK